MKANSYRITIEQINDNNNAIGEPLQLEMKDHENLFNAIETIKQKSGLAPQVATRLAVGVRLLGTTILQERKHPLFVDFFPHFKTFMSNLKKTIKDAG